MEQRFKQSKEFSVNSHNYHICYIFNILKSNNVYCTISFVDLAYNDNTKFVAISINDPVRKYQEKLRDATIKRQMAERELRQLRGY